MTSADSEVTKQAETHSESVRYVCVLRFRLFVLLDDGFVEFVVIVLVIRFAIRIRVIKDSVELQTMRFISLTYRRDGSRDTYVCDECLHQFVGVWHIRQNHKEIVVRSSQQIRTEDDSQCVRCHLVVLLVVCNPKLGLAGCIVE